MNKNVILGLSVVTAVLISTGCSSDGGDTTTGDSSLPSWTGSKVDMNVTSAAVAISEFRKGMDAQASPVQFEMPRSAALDTSEFEQKSAIAIAALNAKRAPVGREQDPALRSSTIKMQSIGPHSEEHNCTTSGNITIMYDSGAWGEEGSFESRTEVHNNCVDSGETLRTYSECAFFPPFESGDGVNTTGSCEGSEKWDNDHWEDSESYTAYKEVWTDSENGDVFTYTVDAEDKDTDVWSDDGSVGSGTYTYTSNGHFDLHGVQGVDGDAWIKVRNEAKSFNMTEKYDYNMSIGETTREDGTINGYFGTSLTSADEEGVEEPSFGYGYYFSNLITEDNYVDENISHFSFGGTFGSACMNGNVVFETTKVLVDDANSKTCEGDDEAMPKDGNVTITGNGMATAMFFEAGEGNSDLNISSGTDSKVYDCWYNLEQCGESDPLPPM